MPQTGLGTALRSLRERRTLTVRELSQLAGVDHAYVHRLETGEKTSPSAEVMGKLLRGLKPTDREAEIVRYLADYPDSDEELVVYVLADASIGADVFAAAAGVRYRGSARPNPATLIERVRKAFE